MRKTLLTIVTLAVSAPSFGALYQESFDSDATANWTYNTSVSGDTRNDNKNNEADYFFNYGAVGIPSAPNSTGGSTIGMKLQANIVGTSPGVFSGMSASPIGQNFFGNYKLTFDAWGNFQGPATGTAFGGGGNGTTQAMGGGILSGDTNTQFPGGTVTGAMFAAVVDGGSTNDYRAYPAGALATDTSGVYAAGNTSGVSNSSNAYYSTFTGSVPAAQTTYASSIGFNNQTGTTDAGDLGMAWRAWEIEKVGNIVTWKVDGKLLATLDMTGKTTSGNNIFFSFFDTNAGASTDAYSKQLLFGLIDNVVVTPEPTSLSTLALGSLLLGRRRK